MAEDKDKPKAVQGSTGVHGKHHSFDAGTSGSTGYRGKHRKDGDVVNIKDAKKKKN